MLHWQSIYVFYNSGHTDTVRWIITNNKVDKNSKDMDGRTALDLAYENTHTDVIRLLADPGDNRYHTLEYLTINPYPAKLNNLNLHPLEFMSGYRDSQLQVAENYWCSFNLTPNICKSWCLTLSPLKLVFMCWMPWHSAHKNGLQWCKG